jgi:hypothetical protein
LFLEIKKQLTIILVYKAIKYVLVFNTYFFFTKRKYS